MSGDNHRRGVGVGVSGRCATWKVLLYTVTLSHAGDGLGSMKLNGSCCHRIDVSVIERTFMNYYLTSPDKYIYKYYDLLLYKNYR